MSNLTRYAACLPRQPNGSWNRCGLPSRPSCRLQCAPVDVERTFGIGKDVAHRIVRSLNADADALEAIHLGPAPESLRGLLREVERKGVSRPTLAAARDALDAFERLILLHTGDRSSFDVLLGGWLPSVADRVELLARQAAFRGMSHLKGCFADLRLAIAFVHPSVPAASEHPGMMDGVMVDAYQGLCRLRPGAKVRVCSNNQAAHDEITSSLQLDGKPARSMKDVILPRWTTVNPAALRFIETGRFSTVEFADDQIGLSMKIHLAIALRHNHCLHMYRDERSTPAAAPEIDDILIPCRRLVFDVYLHEASFPRVSPELRVRDPAADRAKAPGTPGDGRESYFDTADRFVELDPARDRLRGFPGYDALIAHVFSQTGWNHSRFRSYRASIDFPIYGSIVLARLARVK